MAQQGSRGLFQVSGLLMNKSVIHAILAGVPTNGTSGTFAGRAGIGSQITNSLTGITYTNTGTKASPTWTSAGGVAIVRTAQVALTAANFKALKTTPIVVLAAPGSGLAYVVHACMLSMTYGTVQFTSGGVVSFVDHSTHTAVHTGGVAAATVQAAASFAYQLGPLVGANGTSRPLNTGIDIEAATNDFATGDSVGNATIWYSVVTA